MIDLLGLGDAIAAAVPANHVRPIERVAAQGAERRRARPAKGREADASWAAIDVAELVELANRVLDDRARLVGRLGGDNDRTALEDILSVGTSAGGARAKAVLAWNPETGEFRSGQVDTGAGFEHWILKFDGVANNRDRELADPLGFGRIEYAYSRMARAAGVEMARCRLHHEGGGSHFMTRRFDRDAQGRKLHMQSLGALRHFDYNVAGAYAYEQAVETIRLLGLGMGEVEEQVRRAVFNVVARNQDDHVKSLPHGPARSVVAVAGLRRRLRIQRRRPLDARAPDEPRWQA